MPVEMEHTVEPYRKKNSQPKRNDRQKNSYSQNFKMLQAGELGCCKASKLYFDFFSFFSRSNFPHKRFFFSLLFESISLQHVE